MGMAKTIEKKKIMAGERLVLALDLPFEQAKELLRVIGDDISIIKINFLSYIELLREEESRKFLLDLTEKGKDFFLDFKFDDIANTVQAYVSAISKMPYVKFFTIHGNSALMKAAKAGKNGHSELKILIVTVLTSLDQYDLQDIYNQDTPIDVEKMVKHRVEKALELGIDGVIASGREVAMIREIAGKDLTIVTPGVRMDFESNNDHKRPTTPREAIMAGADYLVVGRPIYNSENPSQALQQFLSEMQKAFDEKYNQ